MNLNQKLASTVFLAALFVLATASVARADVSSGKVDMSETEFDNANMTMQTSGHGMDGQESGCEGVSDNGQLSTTVQWLTTNNQTSSDQCNGGNGGDFDKDKDKDGEGGEGKHDDDDTPHAVAPEPTTLLLLGAGLCVLGGALRRRMIAAA